MQEKDIIARLIRLEENNWFQEDKTKKLESEIIEQQKKITGIEKELEVLKGLTLAIRQILSDGDKATVGETPPHYKMREW